MTPDLIAGALIALGAFEAGQWLPRPRRRAEVAAAKGAPEPECGCGHHLSYHDPKSGECHSPMYVPSTNSLSSHHKPCTCRQYSGPQPLPEYYLPEITGN